MQTMTGGNARFLGSAREAPGASMSSGSITSRMEAVCGPTGPARERFRSLLGRIPRDIQTWCCRKHDSVSQRELPGCDVLVEPALQEIVACIRRRPGHGR